MDSPDHARAKLSRSPVDTYLASQHQCAGGNRYLSLSIGSISPSHTRDPYRTQSLSKWGGVIFFRKQPKMRGGWQGGIGEGGRPQPHGVTPHNKQTEHKAYIYIYISYWTLNRLFVFGDGGRIQGCEAGRNGVERGNMIKIDLFPKSVPHRVAIKRMCTVGGVCISIYIH